jgi:SH3-like domain-containing protein
MRQELEQAFTLLDTPITPGAQDESDRAAEWLQPPADNVEKGNETSRATNWRPTHRVGASGLDAWESQQGGQPFARLDPGLDVLVEQSDGDWARVSCDNGWSGWVDRHQLEPRS